MPGSNEIMVKRTKGFSEDEVSVVLLYWIEEELRTRPPLRADSVAQTVRQILGDKPARAALTERLAGCTEALDRFLTDEELLGSVVDAAAERWRVGPDAPVQCIRPRALDPCQVGALLDDGINLGLIFGAENILFQDTVHALQTDETRSRGAREQRVNVLGVHTSWLTADYAAAKRSLLVDGDGRVKEVRFEQPVGLDLVFVLHLPRDGEQALHRCISAQFERLGMLQINPYVASARADDKAETYRLWARAMPAIDSPTAVCVPPGGQVADALGKIAGCPFVFVQPNRGSEGRSVARFSTDDGKEIERFIAQEIWPHDDALLREERGTLRYGSGHGYLHFALRVNVAWNGADFVAESGFGQLAAHPEHPVASRSRGGTMVPPYDALGHLYGPQKGRWRRHVLGPSDLARIKATAAGAARALNMGLQEREYLKLVGVDLLLETDARGGIVPIALDANPRAAGLAQSWMLESPAELGVTHALFEGIRRNAVSSKKGPDPAGAASPVPQMAKG